MRRELDLFAHNLGVFMDKYDYNQTSLANRLNVGVATVNDWVHGRKFPRLGTLDRLTELFHCKRSDLLEKYTTEESIQQTQMMERLMSYMTKLTPDGYEKLLTFFEDLNPKFYRGEEDV